METVVFTNGCFDLFHPGHFYLLSEAKKLGDILVVAVNSDYSFRQIKSVCGPFDEEKIRMRNVMDSGFPDLVFLFHEDTPINQIKNIRPDILVKGDDYKLEEVVGFDCVEKVVLIPRLPYHSTTSIAKQRGFYDKSIKL